MGPTHNCIFWMRARSPMKLKNYYMCRLKKEAAIQSNRTCCSFSWPLNAGLDQAIIDWMEWHNRILKLFRTILAWNNKGISSSESLKLLRMKSNTTNNIREACPKKYIKNMRLEDRSDSLIKGYNRTKMREASLWTPPQDHWNSSISLLLTINNYSLLPMRSTLLIKSLRSFKAKVTKVIINLLFQFWDIFINIFINIGYSGARIWLLNVVKV